MWFRMRVSVYVCVVCVRVFLGVYVVLYARVCVCVCSVCVYL